MKIVFSFFLLIYSWFGTPDSWAVQHTTVYLDSNPYEKVNVLLGKFAVLH